MTVGDLKAMLEMAPQEDKLELMLVMGSRIMTGPAKSWVIRFDKEKVVLSNQDADKWMERRMQ